MAVALAEAMAKGIPGATVHVIVGEGHFANGHPKHRRRARTADIARGATGESPPSVTERQISGRPTEAHTANVTASR